MRLAPLSAQPAASKAWQLGADVGDLAAARPSVATGTRRGTGTSRDEPDAAFRATDCDADRSADDAHADHSNTVTPTPSATAQTAAPAPLPPVQTFTNQTVRMILRSSIGGRRARVKLANAFNGTPVEIGAAHIAIRDLSPKERTLASSRARIAP